MAVEPQVITLPVVTISEPHRLANGKWRVEAKWSDRPTLTYQKTGDTPEEAMSKASEATDRRYASILKSQAAKYSRSAGRRKQARLANSGAAAGQEAG